MTDDLIYRVHKALWKNENFASLGSDAEEGLNILLDDLEWIWQQDPSVLAELEESHASPHADMPVRIGNKERAMMWRNPVGIPAGFSKDGRGAETLMHGLKIGCLELGTTPFFSQPGNPEPRFWASGDASDDGIFYTLNRFGFNTRCGIIPLVHKIWGMRENPECVATPIILSIGPNKTALEEYETNRDLAGLVRHLMLSCASVLPALRKGDALQVNVSSPNTAGLRNLLNRVYDFLSLFMRDIDALARICGLLDPIVILKLSPDMADSDIRKAVSATALCGVPILEAFNTTIDADIKARYGITEAGGVGGDPLRELAERKLAVVMDEIEKERLDIDVIAGGGITAPEHALARLAIHPRVKAVQINSGIYKKGFGLIKDTLAAIHAARAVEA